MSVGDELAEFCRAEWPRLVRLLSLYTGDSDLAEELAQEALLRVCERWRHVQATESPSAWANRVAFNLAKSQFRRRAAHRRARRRQPSEPVAAEPELADQLALRAAVLALPTADRQVLALRYFADLSVHETAALLGCPENTVKTKTRRALQRLRAAGLIDDPIEEPPLLAGESS